MAAGPNSLKPGSSAGMAWLFDPPAKVRWTLCCLHLALIAGLSLMPAWLFPPAPARFPGLDKIVHLAMYGVLGVLLRWAAEERPNQVTGWGLPLAGAGYGFLMEACQLWLSSGGRSFSWADAAANLLGVVAAWLATGRIIERSAGRYN